MCLLLLLHLHDFVTVVEVFAIAIGQIVFGTVHHGRHRGLIGALLMALVIAMAMALVIFVTLMVADEGKKMRQVREVEEGVMMMMMRLQVPNIAAHATSFIALNTR